MEERYNLETLTRIHHSKLLLISIKWILIGLFSLVTLFLILYNVELNAHVSLKKWLSPIQENQESLVCTINNSTPQSAVIIPSVFEHDVCFEFASTIHSNQTAVTTIFHTFWNSRQFSEQQLNSIRSFLHTQPTSKLFVWVFDEQRIKKSKFWERISSDRVQLQVATNDLLQGTSATELTRDTVRLGSLYQHGGVWFELDMLLVRDLSPLLDQEWMSQGNCLEAKPYRFTGSIMHFFKNSPYLCEILSSGRPTFALYSRVYDRYLVNKLKPWTVLPWCYTDPTQCNTGNPGTRFDKDKLSSLFAYHLRPSWWGLSYGSMYRYLVESFDN